MDNQNKNAIKGFAGIAIIIVIIVGVVMILLPGDQTKQESVDENISQNMQEDKVGEVYVDEINPVEFDPEIVKMAEKSIPGMQTIFREVLDKCNAVDSYRDYLVMGNAIFIVQDEMTESVKEVDKALSSLEILGYDKHPTVGPLIKETRQLAGDSGDCVTDLVNKYDN